ncbi:MAG: T9SS type A sorting domain-containing protein [Bacteroidetes bacterium]|nr:T9SS type A sorting domain-containing protein [Bacteroidota bacterium]
MRSLFTLVFACAAAGSCAQVPEFVTDLSTGPDFGYTSPIRESVMFNNNRMVCFIGIPSGNGIITTDATTTGTKPVDLAISTAQIHNPVVMNNKVYYIDQPNTSSAGWHNFLCYTDGINFSGGGRVNDLSDSLELYAMADQHSYDKKALIAMNGKLYFFATENFYNGFELYSSDGTRAGTKKVKDINPLPYTNAVNATTYELSTINGKLIFPADDDTHGNELWISDGTEAGTQILADLNTILGVGSNPSNLIPFGNKMLFNAAAVPFDTAIWITDGTATGTILLKDSLFNMSDYAELNGKLYFYARAIPSGTEGIYETDGTQAGTTKIWEADPLGSYLSYRPKPAWLTAFRGRLYFSAYSAATGQELWQSDGTPSGTKIFMDLDNSLTSTSPGQLTVAGTRMFFKAVRWKNSSIVNVDIWSTDGTVANTVRHDLPNATGQLAFQQDITLMGSPIVPFGKYILFNNSYNTGQSPSALWRMEMNPVGITDPGKHMASFDVYPNPTSDYINIRSEGLQCAAIYTAWGKKLMETKGSRIDVRSLSPGMYIVEAVANDGTVIKTKFSKN